MSHSAVSAICFDCAKTSYSPITTIIHLCAVLSPWSSHCRKTEEKTNKNKNEMQAKKQLVTLHTTCWGTPVGTHIWIIHTHFLPPPQPLYYPPIDVAWSTKASHMTPPARTKLFSTEKEIDWLNDKSRVWLHCRLALIMTYNERWFLCVTLYKKTIVVSSK